jgi:hypothetical protein
VLKPVIEPGVEGAVIIETGNIEAALLPQALFAITLTFPLVEPAMADIDVVEEVPVHPLGKVQE